MFAKFSTIELTPYARGFTDAVEFRVYNDGCYAAHPLVVLCPEIVFSAPSQRQYRRGWLAGQTQLARGGRKMQLEIEPAKAGLTRAAWSLLPVARPVAGFVR
jgi:hypothetical protein